MIHPMQKQYSTRKVEWEFWEETLGVIAEEKNSAEAGQRGREVSEKSGRRKHTTLTILLFLECSSLLIHALHYQITPLGQLSSLH